MRNNEGSHSGFSGQNRAKIPICATSRTAKIRLSHEIILILFAKHPFLEIFARRKRKKTSEFFQIFSDVSRKTWEISPHILPYTYRGSSIWRPFDYLLPRRKPKQYIISNIFYSHSGIKKTIKSKLLTSEP